MFFIERKRALWALFHTFAINICKILVGVALEG